MLMDYKVKGLVKVNNPYIILVQTSVSEGINDILSILGYKSFIASSLEEAFENTDFLPEKHHAVYVLTKISKSKEDSLLEPEIIPYIKAILRKEADELLLNENLNILVTDIEPDELVEYYDLFSLSSPVASIIGFITG